MTDIKKFLKSGTAIGAMAFSTVALAAAPIHSCISGAPAAYSANVSRDASRLLEAIRHDTQRVEYRASVLENYQIDSAADWGANAHQLRRIRAEVDDIGKRLCRLEQLRRGTSAWEQRAIAEARPLVQYMADNTNDAIRNLDAHNDDFFYVSHRNYAQNLWKEARTLDRIVNRHYEQAANRTVARRS